MNYFIFGTNNLAEATQFYDAFFDGMGIEKIHSDDRMTYWQGEDFTFAMAIPFDGQTATNGNGTMAGFCAGSRKDVTRLYATALELGGSSEGEPGERGPRFSAYVRDLDQNKICLFE